VSRPGACQPAGRLLSSVARFRLRATLRLERGDTTSHPLFIGVGAHHGLMVIDAHTRRQLAVLAVCDERTVRKVELGRPVKPTSDRRIRMAAAQLGIAFPVPSEHVTPPSTR